MPDYNGYCPHHRFTAYIYDKTDGKLIDTVYDLTRDETYACASFDTKVTVVSQLDDAVVEEID